MYRIVVMSSGIYGVKVDSVSDAEEDIQEFVDGGQIVILVNELEDLDMCISLKFSEEDVQVVG